MRIGKEHWLVNSPIAHRGLWGEEISENSEAAFSVAIENGYPIETDVRLTKDGRLACFHDDSLLRMTGVDALVRETSYDDISKLRLDGSESRIPLFEDFLSIVGGRVPVLVELKSSGNRKLLVDEVIKALDSYDGEFAVQSFDPLVLREFRKKRPEYIRGQLFDKSRHENLSLVVDKLLSVCFFNFLTKPDFVNSNVEYLPVSKRIKKNRRVLCWTIRDSDGRAKAERNADNYIFERIRPIIKT